ncbi:hypothetical protein [Haloferax larsenii]|uniref:hypothetical protein n=1 Tax=Haloferax larsenii TaxID=302484 RepID=UPI0011140F24|nr:hypothetical protein [Haloferax larsenii]
MLRKIASAAATTSVLAAGAAGSAAAETKEHYVRFEVDGGDGKGNYNVTLPDTDPVFENVEKNGGDDVTVYEKDDKTVVDGTVDGSFPPRYDKYEFDGDMDRFDFSADQNIRVTVNDKVKQDGS